MEEGGEGATIRVVRCPKCHKLLPELANFTFYRCGGCDATLQAKRQIPVSGASLGGSDGERVRYLENDRDNDPIKFRREEKLVLSKATNPDTDSVSNSEDGIGTEGGDGRYCSPFKAPICDPNPNVDELIKKNIEERREIKAQVAYTTNGYPEVQLKQTFKRDAERGKQSNFCRESRPLMEGILPAPYPDVGPSNYHLKNPAYGSGNGIPTHKQNPDVPSMVEHLGQDGAELLRKLDELRDQLRRSCEVKNKGKEKAVVNRATTSLSSHGNRGRGMLYPEGSPLVNQTFGRRSHFLNKDGMTRPNFYHASHPQNGIPRYSEAFRPHTLGRAPFHPLGQYPQRPSNNCLYRQIDPDPVISYHHDGFCHQPACSCLHCYNIHCLPHAHALPSFLSYQRVPYLVNDNGFYLLEGPSMLRPPGYNQRVTNASLHSHEPWIQQRAMLSNNDGRSCRPIDGAFPFIVCHNCFKLLRIPENILVMERNQRKLRCGSCSQVILLEVDGRRISSVHATTMHVASRNSNDSYDGIEEALQCHDHVNRNPATSSSGDYDSSSHDYQSTVDKLILTSPLPISSAEMLNKDYGLNLSESERMQGLSISSSISENVESPDSMICQADLPNSAEFPLATEVTSQFSSLPLREQFGYPSFDQEIDRSGKGSMSKCSDQEKIVSLDVNFKQNSVQDVPVATEMEILVDEYPHPGFSQDSWEGGKDEDEPWISKGSESSLAGFIEKSFKDFSQFNQPKESGGCKVSVNGHPIYDYIVKEAEKLAGPIHPGEYWYDYRAGFWGVMGNQCLGIIPSFIEDFNYPIPKNCAGGNTGVLVNGRELHQKDLDLLVGRGLPATEGRSYIIEISGKVWDEASGEELGSLGKLAPTIEKMKHGFGMRVPSVGA